MRSLISEIRQSQTNALLEMLGYYGVTVEGITSLQNRPPAILKQLSAFIQMGNLSTTTAMSAFPMFSAKIGGLDASNLWRPFYKCDGGLDSGVGAVLNKVASRKEVVHSFVLMDFIDFRKAPLVSFDTMFKDGWLSKWCDENLAGFELKFCREDTAPYIIPSCKKYMIGKDLWIASHSLCSDVHSLFKINFRGGSPWLERHDTRMQGPCYGGSQILFRVEMK